MFNNILNEITNKYDEVDEYVSKILNNSIDEISSSLDSYFNNEEQTKIYNNLNPIVYQLEKLDKAIETLEFNDDEHWDKQLIYVATSLGLISEKII